MMSVVVSGLSDMLLDSVLSEVRLPGAKPSSAATIVSVLVERRLSPRGEVSGPNKTRSLNIMSVAYSRSRRRERWRDTHKASVTQIPSTRDTSEVTDRSSTISDPLDSALGREMTVNRKARRRFHL